MTQPEPLHFAIAHHLVEEVRAVMTAWQVDLDDRRRKRVAEFKSHLATVAVPAGSTFADHVDAQADAVIGRWCAERDSLAQDAVSRFSPETVVAAQQLGMTGQLGELVGQHLDDAVRDLDRDLRLAGGNAG